MDESKSESESESEPESETTTITTAAPLPLLPHVETSESVCTTATSSSVMRNEFNRIQENELLQQHTEMILELTQEGEEENDNNNGENEDFSTTIEEADKKLKKKPTKTKRRKRPPSTNHNNKQEISSSTTPLSKSSSLSSPPQPPPGTKGKKKIGDNPKKQGTGAAVVRKKNPKKSKGTNSNSNKNNGMTHQDNPLKQQQQQRQGSVEPNYSSASVNDTGISITDVTTASSTNSKTKRVSTTKNDNSSTNTNQRTNPTRHRSQDASIRKSTKPRKKASQLRQGSTQQIHENEQNGEEILSIPSLQRDRTLPPAPGALAIRPQQQQQRPRRSRATPNTNDMINDDFSNNVADHDNAHSTDDQSPLLEAHLVDESSSTDNPQVQELLRRVRELEGRHEQIQRQQPQQQEQQQSQQPSVQPVAPPEQPPIVAAEVIVDLAATSTDSHININNDDNNHDQSNNSQNRQYRPKYYFRIAVCSLICLILTMMIVIVVLLIVSRNKNKNNNDDGVNTDVPTTIAPITNPPSFDIPTITMSPTISPVPSIMQPIAMPTDPPMTPPPVIISSEVKTIINQLQALFYGDNTEVLQVLQTSTSNEYHAIEFLLLGPSSFIASPTDLMQRYVLTLLTYSIGLQSFGTWLKADRPTCEWGFVGPNNSHATVECNSMSDMVYLEIYRQHMPGNVPTEIGWLTKLTHLSIEYNTFVPPGLDLNIPVDGEEFDFHSGSRRRQRKLQEPYTIPSYDVISNDAYLRKRQFYNDYNVHRSLLVENDIAITSVLPTEIGLLTQLKILTFEWSVMAGRIPSEIENLNSLLELRLGYNFFTGNIPNELYDLVQLRVFKVGYNNLSGSIPQDLQNLSNLRELSLAFNSFHGRFPTIIDDLSFSKLDYFDVSFNSFTGSARNLFRSSRLGALIIMGNQFTDDINSLFCGENNFDKDTEVSADCLGEPPLVLCDCCNVCCDGTTCCIDYDADCNTVDNVWLQTAI